MVVDVSFTNGFIIGIHYTDEAIIETEEEVYEMTHAVLVHLGLFTIAFIFI